MTNETPYDKMIEENDVATRNDLFTTYLGGRIITNNYGNPLVRMTINRDCPFGNPRVSYIIDSGRHVDNSQAIMKYEPKPKLIFNTPSNTDWKRNIIAVFPDEICAICGCTMICPPFLLGDKVCYERTTKFSADDERHKHCNDILRSQITTELRDIKSEALTKNHKIMGLRQTIQALDNFLSNGVPLNVKRIQSMLITYGY